MSRILVLDGVCVMEDINLNGYLDIVFAQNYIDYPHQTMLNGGVLINNEGKKYEKVNALQNPNYGAKLLYLLI